MSSGEDSILRRQQQRRGPGHLQLLPSNTNCYDSVAVVVLWSQMDFHLVSDGDVGESSAQPEQ